MNQPIILASASPRRYELLRQVGVNAEVIPSEIAENLEGDLSGQEFVQRLALKKAQACANIVSMGIIISADTIVARDDIIYGKPKDFAQAVDMLRSLSGKTHSVITGVAVWQCPEEKYLVDYEETKVVFKSLSNREITSYVNWGESYDKAGGYGIQGKGALLVERIEGDYFNVVGLPLQKLNKMLSIFQINLLER